MGVLWSGEAEADLENINPTVKDRLRRNAEEILPDIRACTGKDGVGNDEIMWHRAITHDQEAGWFWEEEDDGTQAWDYFLFYRRRSPTEFEVLAVRSTRQMASWWVREPPGDASHSERRTGYQRRARYPWQVR
jgi:hypothetical protein